MKDTKFSPEECYQDAVRDIRNLINRLYDIYSPYELNGMFGTSDVSEIIYANDPRDIAARLKGYEEKERIRIGDVVRIDACVYSAPYIGVVTKVWPDSGKYSIILSDGSIGAIYVSDLTKTGMTIDISGILKQLGELEALEELDKEE